MTSLTTPFWRRDERGEYALDAMARRVPLVTFDEFEAVERSRLAAAEHNRKAREAFALPGVRGVPRRV